jgi:hypothetical protein
LAKFQRNIELFTQKVVTKLKAQKYEFGMRDPEETHPGSRGQKGIGSRIRNRNTAFIGLTVSLCSHFAEERGVDNNFAEALSAWCSAHEHAQYINLLQAGLAIKDPPKKTHPKKPTQKTHLKNPTKMCFLVLFGFFKFSIFYENNTNFSL